MQIAERIADLDHPVLHILFALRALLAHDLVQRLTLYVIHDDIDVVGGLLYVDDIHDSRMLELREQLRLAGKALLDRPSHGVGRAPIDLLDGPLLVDELKVARKVHAAHAAFPDQRKDLILALEHVSVLETALLPLDGH